jgi:hypothetical protein
MSGAKLMYLFSLVALIAAVVALVEGETLMAVMLSAQSGICGSLGRLEARR